MFKATVYDLLEGVPRRTRGQRAFDAVLISLILANVLAVILGTVKSLSGRYQALFLTFEILSVSAFTLELMLRFWVSDRSPGTTTRQPRWRFWTNPYTLADILAILPFYLGFLVNVDLRLLRMLRLFRVFRISPYLVNVDLRLLRMLRLFRVFRISPYFHSLALLGSVIKQEYRPMLSALAVIAILMLFAAAGIYLLEREGQPETFGDLPSAMWWVVVTLGIGMVALPAGMLASRFSQVMHRQQDLFRRFVEESLETDGSVSEELFEQRRQELFISHSEAKSIIANCIEDSQRQTNFCPNCGSRLPGSRKA
jgi:voltage-gated potassium channel